MYIHLGTAPNVLCSSYINTHNTIDLKYLKYNRTNRLVMWVDLISPHREFCKECIKTNWPDYDPDDVLLVLQQYAKDDYGIKSFNKYIKLVLSESEGNK